MDLEWKASDGAEFEQMIIDIQRIVSMYRELRKAPISARCTITFGPAT